MDRGGAESLLMNLCRRMDREQVQCALYPSADNQLPVAESFENVS